MGETVDEKHRGVNHLVTSGRREKVVPTYFGKCVTLSDKESICYVRVTSGKNHLAECKACRTPTPSHLYSAYAIVESSGPI